jgi:hypothetical protein
MAIDVASEKLIGLAQARVMMPHEPDIQTVRRYVRLGKLEAFKEGRSYTTSREAVYRYLQRLAKGE